MGNIADGNTISDFDKEEQKRQFSISTTVIPIEFNGLKINVLDTPGYFDFVGATLEGVSAADAAVIVLNAKSGIEVGTHKAWEYCEKYNIPRLMYVSGMVISVLQDSTETALNSSTDVLFTVAVDRGLK